jgi:lipopolysaccharide transport system ATP-binding protein
MSSESRVAVDQLSKCYYVFDSPPDRLKQSIVPRLEKVAAPLARVVGKNITPRRYYREFWALRDVTFTVGSGEMVGIVGPNGAGKSTLLQLVCGTLSPTSGVATVKGRVAALLELGSGFNPEFTGRENIYLNASVLGLSRLEIDAKFERILAFSEIGGFVDQPIKTYSSGMAMRLAFSVIAHVDADVLIVDEALAVGDAYFQQKCMRWLRCFREEGAVLFCGHDTGAVMALCNRAIWLDAGSVKSAGRAKEVCEAYMATVYAKSMGLGTQNMHRSIQGGSPGKLAKAGQRRPLSQSVEVFEFNNDSSWLGTGDATITRVQFVRADGRELGLIEGGEDVQVIIDILATEDINQPIVGFHVKDRLGQALFGDNTFLQFKNANLSVKAGQTIQVRFTFQLPLLQSGDYSLTAAIASGTLDAHVQHHRKHEALSFKVQSPFRNGVMVAIPMQSIELELGELAS